MKNSFDDRRKITLEEIEVLASLLQFLRTEIRNRLHERLRKASRSSSAKEQDLDKLIRQYQEVDLIFRNMTDAQSGRQRKGF